MLQKLPRFEQSLFEAKLATPGSPITESPYRDENFKFLISLILKKNEMT